MIDFKETDLYAPIKAHFKKLGYVVKGEVKGCDVVLARDGEMAVIELKKSFNISLIYQALDRKKLVGAAYVAVPRHVFVKKRGHIMQIMEKLEIGLITVALDSPIKTVTVHFVPKMGKGRNNARYRALMAEMNGRTFDGNMGGSSKQKILTAHRERVLHIACALEKLEQASPAALVKGYGCNKNSGQMLRENFYGWFEKVSRGLYTLSEAGRNALNETQFQEIVRYYRKCINEEYQKLSE